MNDQTYSVIPGLTTVTAGHCCKKPRIGLEVVTNEFIKEMPC